jgi:hypothetical protein
LPERSVGTSKWRPKAQVSGAQRFLFRSKYDSSYATFTPTLIFVVPSHTSSYLLPLFILAYSGTIGSNRVCTNIVGTHNLYVLYIILVSTTNTAADKRVSLARMVLEDVPINSDDKPFLHF